MDIRTFWEALTIGSVSYDLSKDGMILWTIIGIGAALIQFFTTLISEYNKHNYNAKKRDPMDALKSFTAIIYIPVLLFVSSLEFLVLLQFSFNITVFVVAAIVYSIYLLLKIVYSAREDEVACPLGLSKAVQFWGVKIGNEYEMHFIKDKVNQWKAMHSIRKKQFKALKS